MSTQHENDRSANVHSWPKFFYRFRGILMAPPLLFALMVNYGEVEHDVIVFPLGLAVFSLGLAGRIWTQTHLHYRLRVHKVFTCTGPYQFVRNPIYLANTLIILSLCIVSELLWLLPFMLIWTTFVYSMVIRHEESHLLKKYGAPYAQYLNAVPRWFPCRPRTDRTSPRVTSQILIASIAAELHCLLFLIPFIMKEFFDHAGVTR